MHPCWTFRLLKSVKALPVVTCGYCMEALLARGVPDLKFYFLKFSYRETLAKNSLTFPWSSTVLILKSIPIVDMNVVLKVSSENLIK